MRKIITAITAILLAAMMTAGISAYDAETAEKQADALNQMGLFKGTENGYDLDKVPTRAQSSVMLVRFLGKEEEAMGLEYTAPFTDVADWAKPYIQYLWQNGLANGYGDGIYGADDPCTAQMYATIVLRVLGYSDKDAKDFTYDKAIEFATEKGLECPAEGFLRGDMVGMTYSALSMETADGEYERLADRLAADGTISEEQSGTVVSGLRVEREDRGDDGYTLYIYNSEDVLVRKESFRGVGDMLAYEEYYPSGVIKSSGLFWRNNIPYSLHEYDEEGRMTLAQSFGETGVMWHWQVNEYSGNVNTTTLFYNDGTVKQVSTEEEVGERTYLVRVTGYNEDGSVRSQSSNIATEDENGHTVKVVWLDENDQPENSATFEYDENGIQCAGHYYDINGNYQRGWKSYINSKHQTTRYEWYDSNHKLYEYEVYEYDQSGKRISSELIKVAQEN